MKFFMLIIGPYIMPVLIVLLTGYLLNKKIDKKIKEPRGLYREPTTKRAMNEYVNKKCKEPGENDSLRDEMLHRVFGKKGE